MKTAILSLLIWTGTHAFAEDSVSIYSAYIHKAEHLAIGENYYRAKVVYDSAFLYKKPFAVDVFNQLICDLSIRDYAHATVNCKKLIERGATLPFFNQSLFNDFRRSEFYQNLLSEYEKSHQKYLSAVDIHLVGHIKKMVDADQNIHCLLPSKYSDTNFIKKMRMNDDSLSIHLRSSMIDNHLLNEDIIGANFEDDTILIAAPLYYIIALHEKQRGGTIMDSVIYSAIRSGDLKPDISIEWLSQTRMPGLDLTRKYIIFYDTLWKMNESEHNYNLYKQVTGYSDHILKEIYLDDPDFIVEERIVYNFLRQMSTSKNHFLIIFPYLGMITSFNEKKKAEALLYYHTRFLPIKYK